MIRNQWLSLIISKGLTIFLFIELTSCSSGLINLWLKPENKSNHITAFYLLDTENTEQKDRSDLFSRDKQIWFFVNSIESILVFTVNRFNNIAYISSFLFGLRWHRRVRMELMDA